MMTIPWITICQIAGTLISAIPLSSTPMKMEPSAPTRTLPSAAGQRDAADDRGRDRVEFVSGAEIRHRQANLRDDDDSGQRRACAGNGVGRHSDAANVQAPTARAAARLPPMAWIDRPNVVRRSTT